MCLRRACSDRRRRAAATVEMAVLLPLLVFLFVVGVDFARVFHHLTAVANSARSGALYGSRDAEFAQDTEGIKQAVLADASDLTPAPTVRSTLLQDGAGNSVLEVEVAWKFQTITRLPGVPSEVNLVRTVRMRVAPEVPKGTI